MQSDFDRVARAVSRIGYTCSAGYDPRPLPARTADGSVIGTVDPILPDSGLCPPALATCHETVSFVFGRRVVLRWTDRRVCSVLFDDLSHALTWPDFEMARVPVGA